MNHDFFPRLRPLVAALALAALSERVAQAQPASPAPFTKNAMLRDIARNVIAPGYQQLALECRELTNSVGQLVQAPSQTSLDNARKDWLAVSQAASRMRCFQAGPITDRSYASTFYYWQVLPVRIDAVLKSPRPIDPSLLDELGATAKGMFALEYLLFDCPGDQPAGTAKTPTTLKLLTGTQSQRRGLYLLTLARDLEAKASHLATDWTAPGDQGAMAKFVAGGQESVNLLVNQLAVAMEDAAEHSLNFVLELPLPISPQLDRIERGRSGSSLQGLIAALEGVQQMYRGAEGLGLDDDLKRVNAPLEIRLHDQFNAAIAATRAIGAPLEQAVVDDRASLENAHQKTRALEILLKVDLVSALGVTLTFSSNDGD